MAANSHLTIAIHALSLLDEPGGEAVSSSWIASSAGTNPVVVRRMLGKLLEAGLVEGTRGAHGGYRLARPAARITLGEVYRVMREAGPFGLHAHQPSAHCPVGSCIQGFLTEIYDQAELAMVRSLEDTTLAGLKERFAIAG